MRPEKAAIVEELKGHVEASEYAFLADYQGLNVAGMSSLRGKLQEVDSRICITKNTFLGVVMKDLGRPDVSALLTGPTALITGSGDAAQVAKALLSFTKENDKLGVKGGIVGTDVLSAGDVEEMSRIPPREVLLGLFVGTVAAPLSSLVGVMSQKLLSLVYVLKAAEEKKSNQ